MKNGSTLSLWFRLLNLEKASVADLPRWSDGAWSTRSSTWFTPAAVQDRDAAKGLIKFLVSTLNNCKVQIGRYYTETKRRILESVVSGSLVHADETRANIKGTTGFVWVL